MLYADLFTENGLFAAIFAANFPSEFATIFPDVDASAIDYYALMNYGGRILNNKITADNYVNFCNGAISVNLETWLKQASAIYATYNILNAETKKTQRTETYSSSSDNTQLRAQKAFNDTEFSDGERISDNGNSAHENAVTETVIGNGGNVSDNILKEYQLRLHNFQKSVIFALVNEIAILVYN